MVCYLSRNSGMEGDISQVRKGIPYFSGWISGITQALLRINFLKS